VVGIHVSEDAGRDLGQRVRNGMLVVRCLDPPHYAEAADKIDVDWLEPEEAEIREIAPVAAILVASKILFLNKCHIIHLHRFGITD